MAARHESLIGRSAELHCIADAFAQGERLVTLTGTAGVGKTCVALEYASAIVAGRGPFEEVWFCDLTEARSEETIASTLSQALDLDLAEGSARPLARVGDALAGRGSVLLVLDNFEQVVDLAVDTVGLWLARAKGVCVLVTSRERLRLPGERVVALQPLALPAHGEENAEAIQASEAVELFARRARRVNPSFDERPGALAVVADIVRELEGVPLAIELAATRVGMMSLEDVRLRLERRLELLSIGARSTSDRHRALRGAIDWSWQLLSAWEQDALVQCSVFRGGFTLDAAEHVLDLRAHRDAPAVLDVLQALHDKSLLRALSPSAAAECRMGMYASIGEFAAEKLAEAPFATATRKRHQHYYVAIGSRWAESASTAPLAGPFLRRIEADLDNLIAAFWRALAEDDADAGSRGLAIVLAIEPVLTCRGPLSTLLSLLDATVERIVAGLPPEGTEAGDPSFRALVLECRGRARRLCARWAECLTDLDWVLDYAEGVGDDSAAGRALLEMGMAKRQMGRMAEAVEHLEESLRRARTVNDRLTVGTALGELGIVHKEQGRLPQARALYEEALTLLRLVGDRRGEGRFCSDLGALHQEEGALVEARLCFEEALTIHREVGNRRYEAIARSDLGALSFEEGRLEEAEAAYQGATAILRDVGDHRYEALFTACAGAVAAARDDAEVARERLAGAEATLARLGETLYSSAVAVHRGHLDLCLARASDDEALARLHQQRARERLDVARRSPEPEAGAAFAQLSDDVRFAVRVLAKAVDLARVKGCLSVAADASWFQVEDGDPVSLSSRCNLQRMFKALVDARLAEPGRTLCVDALYSVGWPDERVAKSASTNRVHVGLATLRKLGLAPALVRGPGGYMLEPSIELQMASSEAPF